MHLKHLSFLSLASYAAAQAQSLNATLTSNPDLSNLTSFLSLNPSLLKTLSEASNITILAPNNNAFAKVLKSSAGQALASDPGLLSSLLTYHVLNGTYTASQITNTSAFVPTLLTNQSYTNVTSGQRVEAVKVGKDVVFYSGLLQNSTATEANINFTGGVIHIIDSVLTLPLPVVDTAIAANLTALAGAVNATNLIDVVNYTPDLTIFAPANEAFQAIGSALQNLSTSDLTNILGYHVINGTVAYSSDLKNGMTVDASNGKQLRITIENGAVFVNAARVVTPNVLVANGVVHVIDNVLNPSNNAAPSANASSGAPGYSATPVSDVPFTSGQPTPTTTINPAKSTAAGGSSSTGAAMPAMTGAVGYGALLGAGAAVFFGA